MAGVQHKTEIYKPLRPSQIMRSETLVSKVIEILEEEYINPFGVQTDETKLYVSSSGVPLADEVADSIAALPSDGRKIAESFVKERIYEKSKLFHDPINRCKNKTFQAPCKSILVTKGNTAKSVDVNRNILGALLTFSVKNEKAIDIEKALEFPLSPIPLSIANADGSRRQTAKGKLMQVLESKMSGEPSDNYLRPPTSAVVAYIIDFVAFVCTIVKIPSTFEELAWKLLKSIPLGYPRYDFVADT